MTLININEIKHNFPEYLSRAETGESFIITRDGKPVFELKYIEKKTSGKRPAGLCKGEFKVPDDFDTPLPENIIREFEGK